MTKSTDMRLLEARAATQKFNYRTPIKFGGRVVTSAIVLDVEIDVETRAGQLATGRGSMPLGNAWSWPSQKLRGDDTESLMLQFGKEIVEEANRLRPTGDPLQLTHAIGEHYASLADRVTQAAAEPMPRLAQLVAASPLEAAVFDAFGKVLGQNSYNVLGKEFINEDLATYLTPEFAGEYLDQYTLRAPKPRMPLYHLVGALDPLTPDDVRQPVGDGLPETLGQWIEANGLTHLKIKLAGDDLAWDVQRVTAVEHVAAETQAKRGCSQWNYSVDFNERCANVEYVLDFLAQVRERSSAAWDRIQYIEQPTHRDLRANPENRMHRAAAIKPVVIDESLVDYATLLLAREQGYSGVALKACKGHSEALLMGAAAQKHKLFLCVQDLTCVGASFLHSASIAARIPTVAAIEGNGRQYCPEGNRGWDEKYPGMFRIKEGVVESEVLTGNGLGY